MMIPLIEGHTHLKAELGNNKENNKNLKDFFIYFSNLLVIYIEVGV